MRVRLCLFISFVIASLNAFTQQATLYGKVMDKDSVAISYAYVIADSAKRLDVLADEKGNYKLALAAGQYELKFASLGFHIQKIKVLLSVGEAKELNVIMKNDSLLIRGDTTMKIAAIKTKIIDEVVVTGSKYEKKLSEETVSMNVVKGVTLQSQNIVTVDGEMSRIPGVTIADGQVNIRGGAGWSYGAGSRAQVLMDDLPLLSADAADAKWDIIPVENIEQIEVIKGAASALYGTGAMDGIVNLRTAYPTDEPYASVTVYNGVVGAPTRTPALKWWGSDAPMFGGTSFAYRQKFGQSDLVMGGAFNGNTGYLDSSDAHAFRYNIKYRYRFKKIQGLNMGVNATAYYSWGKTFFLWKGIDSLGYQPYPGTVSVYKSYRFTVDPFIDYTDKHNDHFRFAGRYFDARNDNNTGQGSVPDQYYAELQYHRPFNFKAFDMNVVAGIVNLYDNITPPANATGSLFGKNSSYNFSIYAQTDFKFFDRLNISLGARWEYFDMKHYERDSTGAQRLVSNQNSLSALAYPVFRAGVNYQVGKATYIRASFGQGFRYPSIAERYISTSVGPLTIASNPSLQPEKGYNAEIGIKQGFKLGGNWTGYADVAGFYNHYNNMIEFTFGQFGPYSAWNDFTKDFGFGFSSQNVGETRILGTELQIEGQGKIGPVSLRILTGYTFVDPRSLNWNSQLKLYNYQDSMLTNQGVAQAAFNQANNRDSVSYITYAQTSSSAKNVLKYTSHHLFKLDVTLGWKGIEWNTNLQFNSYMENIDYAFVSPLFTQVLDPSNHTSAFTGLAQYRAAKEATPIGQGRGDIVWNMYLAYNFKAGVRVAFIVNNLLNWEYTPRPAYYESPRNYTVQLNYTFKGKKKEKVR